MQQHFGIYRSLAHSLRSLCDSPDYHDLVLTFVKTSSIGRLCCCALLLRAAVTALCDYVCFMIMILLYAQLIHACSMTRMIGTQFQFHR